MDEWKRTVFVSGKFSLSRMAPLGFSLELDERAVFHACTHITFGDQSLPGHMFGTACQHSFMTTPSLTTVSGVDSELKMILVLMSLPGCNATSCLIAPYIYIYRVVQKKRYPSFNFAITSVNVHRF